MVEIFLVKETGILMSVTKSVVVEDSQGLSQLVKSERSNALFDDSLHSILILQDDHAHVNGIYPLETIQRDIMSYVYDTQRGFLQRPYFQFYIDDTLVENLGVIVKKINTQIKVTLKYTDPDGVGFDKKFEFVKFKDREYLIDVGATTIKLDQTTLSYSVEINSPFPGVSTFRAKDEFFVCKTSSIQVRYRP